MSVMIELDDDEWWSVRDLFDPGATGRTRRAAPRPPRRRGSLRRTRPTSGSRGSSRRRAGGVGGGGFPTASC